MRSTKECIDAEHNNYTYSVVTVTATSTATAVFICHRTSTANEVEIGASDGVAGQCITFITTTRLRFRKSLLVNYI